MKSESDTARVSGLPVAGCKFPAVFLGKVDLDVVGLGVDPPCFRVDSEETLLTLIHKRAQLVRAAPGVTPEDGSVEGAPVLELIEHSFWESPWLIVCRSRCLSVGACDSGDSLGMGATRTFVLCPIT